MKVAIGFFGIPRNSAICLPSIRDNIFACMPKGAELHVFYHMYRQSHVISQRSGEGAALDPINYHYFDGYDGILEDPSQCLRQLEFERVKAYGDSYGDNWDSTRNLMLQLNSLRRVTQIISQADPDCVGFVRPDLLYVDAWDPKAFAACSRNPRLTILPDWQPWGGENDRFAICGRASFPIYGHRIDDAVRYCEEGARPLHAEKLLNYSLRRARMKIRYISWRAKRVRACGTIADESFRKERPRKRTSSLRDGLKRLRTDWTRRLSRRPILP